MKLCKNTIENGRTGDEFEEENKYKYPDRLRFSLVSDISDKVKGTNEILLFLKLWNYRYFDDYEDGYLKSMPRIRKDLGWGISKFYKTLESLEEQRVLVDYGLGMLDINKNLYSITEIHVNEFRVYPKKKNKLLDNNKE